MAHKTIGVFNEEVFFVDGEYKDNKFIPNFNHNMDVIRYISKDRLAELHDIDTFLNDDEWKYLWKESVAADRTLESFEDWMQEVFNEEDDGDEYFIGKDDSFVDYLTNDERELVDKFILDTYDVEVGTWEASGCYHPTSTGCKFETFDFEVDKELCKAYYDFLRNKTSQNQN